MEAKVALSIANKVNEERYGDILYMIEKAARKGDLFIYVPNDSLHMKDSNKLSLYLQSLGYKTEFQVPKGLCVMFF